jgi:hypothetical protein
VRATRDEPDRPVALAYSRIQAATVRAAFGDVGLIGGAAMPRGRRAGNVVLVAGHSPGDLPVPGLAAAAACDPEPGRVLHDRELDLFLGGAKGASMGRSDRPPVG